VQAQGEQRRSFYFNIGRNIPAAGSSIAFMLRGSDLVVMVLTLFCTFAVYLGLLHPTSSGEAVAVAKLLLFRTCGRLGLLSSV
jgi:hypothetical protein